MKYRSLPSLQGPSIPILLQLSWCYTNILCIFHKTMLAFLPVAKHVKVKSHNDKAILCCIHLFSQFWCCLLPVKVLGSHWEPFLGFEEFLAISGYVGSLATCLFTFSENVFLSPVFLKGSLNAISRLMMFQFLFIILKFCHSPLADTASNRKAAIEFPGP